MRVHFIAIGGAVMHNLAIALKLKGYDVSGSDDEIFEPSKSRLAEHGILPPEPGWHPERITSDLDAVILGMHAREDNPELVRARELGLCVKSFPEYLYEQTKDKKRIIVAGSHGKTTVTAMIMHVFKTLGVKFDYMVGSIIEGFDTMVGLSDDSEYAVFEGDEYLTSPLDRRPKIHIYMPDIAVLNGIAWDHKNVFPTFENYVDQFRIFLTKITDGGTLIYYKDDVEVNKLAEELDRNVTKIPYTVHDYFQTAQGTFLKVPSGNIKMQIFGRHNMQNIAAAKAVCEAIGISDDDFYMAISTFTGTKKRLQQLYESEKGVAYLDFAHSPSKVSATVDAIAERYPGRDIVACLELHTFSSLSEDFLPLYKGTLDKATRPYVYFSHHALELKKLPPLSKEDVNRYFCNEKLKVFDDSDAMFDEIKRAELNNPVLLFMSSGNFDGHDMTELAKGILQ